MSSQPPIKRKRIYEDSDSGSETSEVAIVRSKYWFDDGNIDIIIQVENTQFRVHWFMLCRHSTVFKDMFDNREPSDTDQHVDYDVELVEGCPLIHLSDKASDFEYVMSIFYDNIRFHDMRLPMLIEHCAAILRLGKKYNIEHLFDEGLRRFRHEFPRTLSEWVNHSTWDIPGKELACDDMFHARAMALAQELSINTALPAICFLIAKHLPTGEILENISIMKDDPEDLDCSRLLTQCLKGRDKILRRILQTYQDWACSESASPIPGKKCTNIESCTSSRALAVMIIPSELAESSLSFGIMDRVWLPPRIDDLICEKCKQSLEAALEQFRVNLWRDLPSIFDLTKSWSALKDF